VNDFQTM